MSYLNILCAIYLIYVSFADAGYVLRAYYKAINP